MIPFRLPYLNDRTNQLLYRERTEHLYWTRFKSTKANHRYLWGLWLQAMICGPFTAVVLDSFRIALLIPLVPLLFDLVRLFVAGTSEPPRKPQNVLSALPLSCCWFSAVLLAGAIAFAEKRLWPVLLVAVAVWWTLRLCTRLNRHYVEYTLESLFLSVERRAAWREVLNADWLTFPPPIQPGRSDLTEAELAEFHKMRRWLLMFRMRWGVLVAGVFAVCGVYLFLTWQLPAVPPWATCAFCWSIALVPVLGLVVTGIFCPRSTWRALVNWCWSPPDVWPENRAPWTGQSPCGSCWSRQAELLWSQIIVGCCLIPPAALHPMEFATPDVREQFAIPKEEVSHLILGTWAMFTMMMQFHVERLHAGGLAYLLTLVFIVPVFVSSTVLFVSGPSLHAAHRLFQSPTALEHDRHELLQPTAASAETEKEPPKR